MKVDLESTEGTPTVEAQMLELGRRRYRRRIQSAVEGKRRSTVGGAKDLLRAAVKVVTQEVDRRLSRKGRGRRHAAFRYVRQLKTGECVYITLRTLIDQLADEPEQKMVRLACLIGSRIEDEVRFRAFKKGDRRFFRRMMDRIEDSNDYRYKHRVLTWAHNMSDEAEQWEPWGRRIHALLGSFLIEAVMDATGLFEMDMIQKGKKRFNVLRLTTEAVEEIRRRDAQQELLRPWYLPTVNEPVPWVIPSGGGYGGETIPPYALVKDIHNSWHYEQLKQTPMPKVYKAINALQRTPWQINEDVLCVVEELWGSRSQLGGLPVQDPLPFPARPEWLPDPEPGKLARLTKEQREALTDDQKLELRTWKIRVSDTHAENGRQRSQVVATTKILVVADMYRHFDRFYFPHHLDWRGRAYATPLFLNPQGNDLARGLLRFAESRPLGHHGAFWLAVHGANSWGEDKASLEDRVDWVHAHEERIVEVAEDPLVCQWWTEADEPWQFLAFCLEWAGYVESGYSQAFESRLPVAMDGSCNGLQHYSAMLRDRQGAEATNLLPTDKPRDIYVRVAERLTERLLAVAKPPGEAAIYAGQWLDSKLIDRAFVKRQVMTLPYGVTRHGMEAQLVQHCRKEKIDLSDYFEDQFGARRFLIDQLWKSIEDTVHAAVVGMEFLQSIARAAADEGLPVVWVAPTGFPVRQHYPAMRSKIIQTMLLGRLLKLSIQEEDWSRLDRRRQVAAIAPNFVHSLDAAHMMLTVVATEREVFRPVSWAMVHDSFGTHAGDAETLAMVLRRQFVKLYEDRDVLEELRKGMAQAVRGGMPECPERGHLALDLVKKADYFFA